MSGYPRLDSDGVTALTESIRDKAKFQFTSLPEPSQDYLERVIQYIGEDTSEYTSGYFYECVLENNQYIWKQKNVSPGGGSDYHYKKYTRILEISGEDGKLSIRGYKQYDQEIEYGIF